MTISKIYTKLRKRQQRSVPSSRFLHLPFGSPDLILRSDVLRADGTEFSAGGWRYQKNGFSAASNYRLRLLPIYRLRIQPVFSE